jgi:type IV pilus assembly protein PilB
LARKRIGDLLYEAGILTAEQLNEALKFQKQSKGRLGDILIEQKFITENQLIEVLEFQLGIPHVNLSREKIDPSVLSLIPEAMANRYLVMPIRKERNKLFVAMADPMDYYAIDDMRMSTGFQVEVAIATKDEVKLFIERYYGMKGSLDEAMQSMGQVSAASAPAGADAELLDEDSPVVRLVSQILSQAVGNHASDVHLDPMENGMNVRFRIDGSLRTVQSLPKTMQSVVTARLKVMASLNIAEHRLPQDGRFRVTVDFREIDVRVSILPTIYGEKTVLRVLDLSNNMQKIEQIQFTKENLLAVRQMLSSSSGMVLATGPTGSGKTSTLYAALTELNQPAVNIITVEDPVEYRLTGVNQVAVNEATGLTFARGLRSILRQDPDIVMVGEIRDTETAEIAIRAAMTGHLVLSTLHTNDSISSIARLIDMGVDRFLVATALRGIIAQRLVRMICNDCKIAYTPTTVEQELLQSVGLAEAKLMTGRGCPSCSRTGFRGRVAIHEVLPVDDTIRAMILHGQPEAEIRNYATNHKGFHTLLTDGLGKAATGITTVSEVLRVASPDQ